MTVQIFSKLLRVREEVSSRWIRSIESLAALCRDIASDGSLVPACNLPVEEFLEFTSGHRAVRRLLKVSKEEWLTIIEMPGIIIEEDSHS